jgi:hypothetical protein
MFALDAAEYHLTQNSPDASDERLTQDNGPPLNIVAQYIIKFSSEFSSFRGKLDRRPECFPSCIGRRCWRKLALGLGVAAQPVRHQLGL